MKKKTILLTGDDGFDSLGTRLLIHLLKNTYTLVIAGTKTQQSGVGGHKSIMGKGEWGEEMVDGVPALWVNGTPVDAVEAARSWYPQAFDYIISGMNWGINVAGSLCSSGTFSAAFFAMNLGLAPRAIAISWDISAGHHFTRHTIEDGIEAFINHPGRSAKVALTEAFRTNCWGAAIVNINIPAKETKVFEFARPLEVMQGLWPPIELNKNTGMFSYKSGDHVLTMGSNDTDVQVVRRGHIAITPCQATMIDSVVYRKMTGKK
ncbi:MAG: 5'/3'-nucleotidase SurE [Candidatus Gottesmanbacteria bacterium]